MCLPLLVIGCDAETRAPTPAEDATVETDVGPPRDTGPSVDAGPPPVADSRADAEVRVADVGVEPDLGPDALAQAPDAAVTPDPDAAVAPGPDAAGPPLAVCPEAWHATEIQGLVHHGVIGAESFTADGCTADRPDDVLIFTSPADSGYVVEGPPLPSALGLSARSTCDAVATEVACGTPLSFWLAAGETIFLVVQGEPGAYSVNLEPRAASTVQRAEYHMSGDHVGLWLQIVEAPGDAPRTVDLDLLGADGERLSRWNADLSRSGDGRLFAEAWLPVGTADLVTDIRVRAVGSVPGPWAEAETFLPSARRAGQSCDRLGLFWACDAGTYCAPRNCPSGPCFFGEDEAPSPTRPADGLCLDAAAPELNALQVVVNRERGGLGITLSGTDPASDLRGFLYELLDADGAPLPLPEVPPDVDPTNLFQRLEQPGDGTFTAYRAFSVAFSFIPQETLDAARSARVRVVDWAGNVSEGLESEVAAPQLVARGAECDELGLLGVCGADDYCNLAPPSSPPPEIAGTCDERVVPEIQAASVYVNRERGSLGVELRWRTRLAYATQIGLTLRDAQGGVVELPPGPHYDLADVTPDGDFHSGHLILDWWAPDAVEAEVVVVDLLGLESLPRVVPLTPPPELASGATCDALWALGTCAAPEVCTYVDPFFDDVGTCAPAPLPEIHQAHVFLDPGEGAIGVRLAGIGVRVDGFHARWFDAAGQALEDPLEVSSIPVSPWDGRRLAHTAFATGQAPEGEFEVEHMSRVEGDLGGIGEVELVALDFSGARSLPLRVAVEAAPQVGLGEACSVGFIACPADAFCDLGVCVARPAP